jgi:hypothetical protein
VDDLVSPLEDDLGIEPARDHPARARHALDLIEQLAGPQQRLRRHARVVGTLAPDQLLLDQGHLESALAQPAGADLPCRPGPDHDRIELPLAHPSSRSR